MNRAVFENVEREIDNEMRARFPADAIKQAVLLHHGDDPEIEPGQLWVRVLLPGDRPEEYEQILTAFWRDHRAAIEEIPRYLAETLREIRLVEFTFSDNPVTSASHSYRRHLLVGDQLAGARARERGEARVDARLGSANLETVDMLIMVGIADDRADAIGWALARFRQQSEYEQLRECIRETGRLRAAHRPQSEADTDCAVFDSIEREIDHEVRKRFPGDAVRRVVLQHYGDDPEIEPGQLFVRVLLRADRPEDYEQMPTAFEREHQVALEEFPRYLAENMREIRLVEFIFGDSPVTEESAGPVYRTEIGQGLAEAQAWELGEATHVPARQGAAGLETLDTLIMTGIADDREDAIGWVLAGFRQQPEYDQLRERVAERIRAEL